MPRIDTISASLISEGSKVGFVRLQRPNDAYGTGEQSVVTFVDDSVEMDVREVWKLFRGLDMAARNVQPFKTRLARKARVTTDYLGD